MGYNQHIEQMFDTKLSEKFHTKYNTNLIKELHKNFNKKGVIMEENNIIRTMFSVYRFLDKIADHIDLLISRRAMNAYCMELAQPMKNSSDTVASDIIELSEEKIDIINVKILVEEVLKRINSKHARMIIMKYVDNMSMDFMIRRFQVTSKTLYRWELSAINSAIKILNSLGYSLETLHKLLKSNHYLSLVYSRFENAIINESSIFDIVEINEALVCN